MATMGAARERTGLFMVRVWTEDQAAQPFRARVTSVLDVAAPEQVVNASASADDICDRLRAWLDAFTSAERPTGQLLRRREPGPGHSGE
jgi:hypothetical protein